MIKIIIAICIAILILAIVLALRKRGAKKKDASPTVKTESPLTIINEKSLETNLPTADEKSIETDSPITTSDLPPTIIGKDGAEMVLIPAGEFQMGGNIVYGTNDLVHTVYLDAFYIDKYEVTNAQYKKFMDATRYKAPYYWDDSRFSAPNQPVVGVTWHDAKAYCKWAGKRLPTEAEWEKSARGGLVGKKYVWGDEWPPPSGAGNFDDSITKDGYEYTSPVGSFKPNGYGLYDMAGNVLEWCADWYGGNYYASSPKSNPKGPRAGEWRVLRGGSWGEKDVNYLRVASRYYFYPASSAFHRLYDDVGFRCVQ